MDCPKEQGMGPMDRCQTVTTDGVLTHTCSMKAANDLLQIKDNACTKKTSPLNEMKMEFCVCDKEGCNSPSSAKSASISKGQFANQVILIVAVSALMNLLLN